MSMITTKQISVKMDEDTLTELDNYCKEKSRFRNREINIAVSWYLQQQRLSEIAEKEEAKAEARQFFYRRFGIKL